MDLPYVPNYRRVAMEDPINPTYNDRIKLARLNLEELSKIPGFSPEDVAKEAASLNAEIKRLEHQNCSMWNHLEPAEASNAATSTDMKPPSIDVPKPARAAASKPDTSGASTDQVKMVNAGTAMDKYSNMENVNKVLSKKSAEPNINQKPTLASLQDNMDTVAKQMKMRHEQMKIQHEKTNMEHEKITNQLDSALQSKKDRLNLASDTATRAGPSKANPSAAEGVSKLKQGEASSTSQTPTLRSASPIEKKEKHTHRETNDKTNSSVRKSKPAHKRTATDSKQGEMQPDSSSKSEAQLGRLLGKWTTKLNRSLAALANAPEDAARPTPYPPTPQIPGPSAKPKNSEDLTKTDVDGQHKPAVAIEADSQRNSNQAHPLRSNPVHMPSQPLYSTPNLSRMDSRAETPPMGYFMQDRGENFVPSYMKPPMELHVPRNAASIAQRPHAPPYISSGFPKYCQPSSTSYWRPGTGIVDRKRLPSTFVDQAFDDRFSDEQASIAETLGGPMHSTPFGSSHGGLDPYKHVCLGRPVGPDGFGLNFEQYNQPSAAQTKNAEAVNMTPPARLGDYVPMSKKPESQSMAPAASKPFESTSQPKTTDSSIKNKPTSLAQKKREQRFAEQAHADMLNANQALRAEKDALATEVSTLKLKIMRMQNEKMTSTASAKLAPTMSRATDAIQPCAIVGEHMRTLNEQAATLQVENAQLKEQLKNAEAKMATTHRVFSASITRANEATLTARDEAMRLRAQYYETLGQEKMDSVAAAAGAAVKNSLGLPLSGVKSEGVDKGKQPMRIVRVDEPQQSTSKPAEPKPAEEKKAAKKKTSTKLGADNGAPSATKPAPKHQATVSDAVAEDDSKAAPEQAIMPSPASMVSVVEDRREESRNENPPTDVAEGTIEELEDFEDAWELASLSDEDDLYSE